MPLHLLGKKSWNVYNADNIARVRRDEAAAKAKEEAEDQRMQEVDAERRLAILRGEVPPPLPPTETPEDETRPRDRDAGPVGRERKKRKRAGEDDTEFELRVAKERADVVQTSNEALRQSTSSAPIVDSTGHIDLFGEERKQGRHLKNEEAEKEAAKKKKELEDQYTMRFSNAAGRDGLRLSDRESWSNYAGRRGARRDMNGKDENTKRMTQDAAETDPTRKIRTKNDADQGGKMTVITERAGTMSALKTMTVVTWRGITDTNEGMEATRDDQQKHEVVMKQGIDQRVGGTSGTPTHGDEMKIGGQQNPVTGTDINYRGTKNIYNYTNIDSKLLWMRIKPQ
ncbi:putative blastn match against entry EMBL [Colletotrichum tofieldiae]|nr:putative blastn match against entry EMBL [Colletotrichum tofieldiae]GKT76742.1 putative blastn match against entry EMBL [Colletotrichum tofieldiae]